MFFQTNLELFWLVQTPERDFRIKISGLEIYNENVKDLLNSESGRNLKLLDDPEVFFKNLFLLSFVNQALVFP